MDGLLTGLHDPLASHLALLYAHAWGRLAAFLEVHAEAEERHFYPALLRVGTGAGGKPSASKRCLMRLGSSRNAPLAWTTTCQVRPNKLKLFT